jgi:type IV pilus assembly protein PilE
MNNKNQGFTLIELMVSVAIIAILMAIAMPRYQQSVVRNNRVAVQAEMMQIAGLMEGIKARQMTYGSGSTVALTDIGRSVNFPSSGTANYTLAISLTGGGSGWKVLATPVGRQATVNDGRLALDSLGRQCWTSGNNAGCDTDADMISSTNAWSSSR